MTTHRLSVLLITRPLPPGEYGGGAAIFSRRFGEIAEAARFGCTRIEVDTFKGWGNRLRRWKAEFTCGFPFYADASWDMAEVEQALSAPDWDLVIVEHLELYSAIRRNLNPMMSDQTRLALLSHGFHSLDYFYFEHSKRDLRGLHRSIAHDRHVGRLLRHESELMRDAAAVWTLNEAEGMIAQWLGAEKTLVVPQLCKTADVPNEPVERRYGFVGTLSHPINALDLDAVIQAVAKDGGAAKTLELRIVGRVPERWRHRWAENDFVSLLGPLSDAELLDEIPSWAALLHPIFHWAKGRSLKVATAMEWGRPIVSTPAGVRGYALTPMVDYISASNPKEFVDVMMSASAGTRAQVVRAGMLRTRNQSHTLEACAATLSDQVDAICGEPPTREYD